MKVAVGFDHGGYNLKETICELIKASGNEVVDMGAYSLDPQDDYPDFAIKVAEGVAASSVSRGIIVCGSGVGASIAANKIKGIRAALCSSAEMAKLSRNHNDANVLALGARLISKENAISCLKVFLREKWYLYGQHFLFLA